MIKRYLAILLIMSVFLILGSGSGAVLASQNNYDKQYTYTVSMMNPEIVKQDPRYKYLKDKFNVDFKFRPVNWSNWNEKVRIWTASGDMPDIMWMDFNDSNFSEYVNWASQGAYKPLPKLKGKYPHLYQLRQKLKTDDYWEIDGKLYAWPIYMNSAAWRNPIVSTFSFIYRVDWAKAVGLYHADNNYSWQEMKEMALAFKQQDPGENGKDKTIGIAGIGWSWPWFAGLIQTHQSNDFPLKNGKYVWGPAQPEYLAGIKEIKSLYDQGILWEDQPIANNNAARNKFIAGELGIYYTNVNVGDYYNNVLVPMQQAQPDLDIFKDIEPMYVASPRGNFFDQEVVDYWSATLFSPEMSDDKLARWLELSDYMASQEGMNLATIGIKDKNYRLKDNGEIELLWPEDENGKPVNPFDSRAIRFFELTTMHDKFALNDPSVPEEVKADVKGILRRHLKDDVNVLAYPYQVNWFNGSTYTRYVSRIADTNAEISEAVVSSQNMAELEASWQEYLKSKETTVNKILKEINQQLLEK